MKCRYCNVALAPLRSLTDGEFCSDSHRRAFEGRGASPAEGAGNGVEPAARTAAAPREQSSSQDLQAIAQNLSAFDFQNSHVQTNVAQARRPASGPASEVNAAPLESVQVAVEQESEVAADSACAYEPARFSSQSERASGYGTENDLEPENSETGETAGAPGHPSFEVLSSWQWINTAWHKAPRDLKILLVALPVLLALAIGPSVPKVKVQVSPAAANDVQKIVASQWKDLQQTISNRAAVAFSDDFRSGLDSWESRSNLTRSWSYDASGFVRPGPLAIFKPTTELSDYRFEFLEEIDQRAMGCAFRAADLDNYYAVKLVVARPGPLPIVHLVRYAVIRGKEGPHVEKPLPFTTRADTLYRMLVDVRGGDFTIMVQGQVVDFWSDSRLRQGGIGFFCNRGERARLRWVEVSHQYDALGRLCAYLAPYGIDVKNGGMN